MCSDGGSDGCVLTVVQMVVFGRWFRWLCSDGGSDGCVLTAVQMVVFGRWFRRLCSDGGSDGCVLTVVQMVVFGRWFRWLCSDGGSDRLYIIGVIGLRVSWYKCGCSHVVANVLSNICLCSCTSCDVVKYTSYTTVSRIQST